MSHDEIVQRQRELLESLLIERQISGYIAWYYTPMAREFSNHLHPGAVIYDCMDELSAFAGAPPTMRANEQDLFDSADLVFTGGASLYEAKRQQHRSVYQFASSVDVAHFVRARVVKKEPEDQSGIPRPRIGYAGVIDERMDIALLDKAAELRPGWQFVLLGPVLKIDPATLPKRANIHYLGMKAYQDLPAYFGGWDIGMLPFALNESTRYISPTKTPEYLAAGLRVISTPIRDVVTSYGDLELVGIVKNAGDFVRIADFMLHSPFNSAFQGRADAFLSQSSWDGTWSGMNQLIEEVLSSKGLSAVRAGRAASFPAMAMKGAAHV
ncbi:MAG: glycosyltransferase family 1 protein [Acidobacteriota bacterium]|nr:glycosyltransferase family 1 protein [Acidobacteriota bacterium]